jgi:V8-like Glu-specific endopeptidase
MRDARPVMPHLDPRAFPPAAFLRGNALPSGKAAPAPGASAGSSDGTHTDARAPLGRAPDAYGNASPLSIAPYTIARASASALGATTLASEVGVTSAPWRSTGALYFKNGSGSGSCSAAMILPGLLATAAHCVFNFGANSNAGFHTDFKFYPALYGNVVPPYGIWTATTEYISSTYYNGTDTCLTRGVSCNNDIAIIVMARNAAGKLPGNVVGWYGYGWEGYSFTPSFGGASLASITQLGYPAAFDSGYMMERNDGIGAYYTTGNLKNTVLGSPMTGGASGGPWIVNFGAVPSIVSPASAGNYTTMSVVGVTSWDYTTPGSQLMGASWFGANAEFPKSAYLDSHNVNRGSGNIGFLVSKACSAYFDHC